MMNRMLLVGCLLFAAVPNAAQAQFIGPVKTTEYYGCASGNAACFTVTLQLGHIAPFQFGINNPITTLGWTLTMRSTWSERGYLSAGGSSRWTSYNGGPGAPIQLYDDFGYFMACWGITATCGPTPNSSLLQIFTGSGLQPLPYWGAEGGVPILGSFDVNFVSSTFPAQLLRSERVALSMVPEPTSYALMALGLFLIGGVAVRRV